MKKSSVPVILLAIAACFLTSCCKGKDNNAFAAQGDTLQTVYQVSTLQALVAGYYYPVCTVGELLKHGNFGIGTFEAIDGEMSIIDGVCYQAKGDGSVVVVDTATCVPFAAVLPFVAEKQREVKTIASLDSLRQLLDDEVKDVWGNLFVACRIDGTFPKMHVRSELKQEKPYRKLAETLKTAQREFVYTEQEGTVIALYCPEYAKDINSAGWHLHYISNDRTKSGHIIALEIEQAHISLDKVSNMSMHLPDDSLFNRLNLVGQEKDVRQVEQGR